MCKTFIWAWWKLGKIDKKIKTVVLLKKRERNFMECPPYTRHYARGLVLQDREVQELMEITARQQKEMNNKLSEFRKIISQKWKSEWK